MKQLHLFIDEFCFIRKELWGLQGHNKKRQQRMLQFPPSTYFSLGSFRACKKCLLFVSSYIVNLFHRIEVIICSVVEREILILSLKMHQAI